MQSERASPARVEEGKGAGVREGRMLWVGTRTVRFHNFPLEYLLSSPRYGGRFPTRAVRGDAGAQGGEGRGGGGGRATARASATITSVNICPRAELKSLLCKVGDLQTSK